MSWILAACAGLGGFLLWIWLARDGGTTPDERGASMPGDDLVPRACVTTTQAVTVAAPPAAVWPWIVQIGQGRGGFYSHAWLENRIGCRIENADRVLPEFQDLQPGDPVPMHPSVEPFVADVVEPPGTLVLRWRRGRGRGGADACASSWCFALRPVEADETRLVVRMRMDERSVVSRTVLALLVRPGHGVMERAMLRGIRRRAERAHRAAAQADATTSPASRIEEG